MSLSPYNDTAVIPTVLSRAPETPSSSGLTAVAWKKVSGESEAGREQSRISHMGFYIRISCLCWSLTSRGLPRASHSSVQLRALAHCTDPLCCCCPAGVWEPMPPLSLPHTRICLLRKEFSLPEDKGHHPEARLYLYEEKWWFLCHLTSSAPSTPRGARQQHGAGVTAMEQGQEGPAPGWIEPTLKAFTKHFIENF